MIKKFTTYIFIILLAFSCSSNKKKETPTAEKDYLKAYKVLKRKNYSEAGDLFEKIDDDYPFSKWGSKAKTMAVYARYKNEEYDKLSTIVDDFTKLNPVSEYNPYLLYMKGRAYFNKIPHIKRAQDDTQISSYVFRELIARYPDSEYAKDAKSKLNFIDEHIAGHIMEIGQNEIKNKNYIGALKHFQKITYRYRYTEQISESYFRIYEIFTKLGINSEALKAKRILETRYADSYWVKNLK
ncbi:MAG: outer membrane protein assembly factor BamD [Rickettsiales bacterium]|nr:outer membrane protein assembly factor BamD [Rickettsiales bacterium]